MRWFDTPVIGDVDPFEREEALLFADEDEGLESTPFPTKGGRLPQRSPHDWTFEGLGTFGRSPFRSQPKLWMHTSHAFGYIAPQGSVSQTTLPILPVSNIRTNKRLQNGRLNITLDRLRVCSYPGKGTHRVLLHFYAQNQTTLGVEDLHWSSVYRVREGEQAALRGYPLFVGLNVGTVGVRLRVRTINVGNDNDEAFLHFFETDVFKSGLQIATTAQPVLAPFSQMAFGLAKALASRHQNVSVQDFDMGLDFGSSPFGARLAEGSYLAVQMPEGHLSLWDWSSWFYYPSSGQIRNSTGVPLEYNYLVFSIQRSF